MSASPEGNLRRLSVQCAVGALLIIAVGSSLSAQDSGGIGWDLGVMLHGTAGLGDLEAVARFEPNEIGPDAMLLRDELLATSALSPQTSAQLRAEVVLKLGAAEPQDGRLRPFDARISAITLFGYGDRPIVAAPGSTFVGYRFGSVVWGAPRFVVRGGRLRLVDARAALVDQLVDGVSLAARWPGFYASLGFGTTALIDEAFFTPRGLPGDGEDFADARLRAPTRLLALARLEAAFPADQAIGLAGAWYDDPLASGAMIWHVDLVAEGRLAPVFSLSHRTRVGLRVTPDGVGLAGDLFVGAEFSPLPLCAELEMRYASGGERLASYLPITPLPTGPIIALPASDLLSLGGRLSATIGRRSDAPVSLPVEPWMAARVAFTAAAASWTGSEALLGIDVPLLADVSTRFIAGIGWMPVGVQGFLRMEGRIEL